MSDRDDIVETCTKMAWFADQRDWDALTDVFCDEVHVDYTSLNGGEPATMRKGDIVAGWAALLGRLAATQHMVANHLVTVDGDIASCTATFQATHVYPNPLGEAMWTLGGDYLYELRRDDEAWRIAGVTMTAKWSTGNQHVMTLAAEGASPERATS